ncbi:MAG: thiamine diphosphokinase, partial [Angelakisella sp.]
MGAVKQNKSCLIVGAGAVTPEALLRCGDLSEQLIIAADGGYLHCRELGITPTLILGDFDSAPMPETTAETQVFPAHKDDTDCMLAAKEGLRRGCTRFTILGGLGVIGRGGPGLTTVGGGAGRLDHTMANIQTLVYLVSHGCTAYLLDEQQQLTVLMGDCTAEAEGKDVYLSLFSLGDRCTGVTLRSVEYP